MMLENVQYVSGSCGIYNQSQSLQSHQDQNLLNQIRDNNLHSHPVNTCELPPGPIQNLNTGPGLSFCHALIQTDSVQFDTLPQHK